MQRISINEYWLFQNIQSRVTLEAGVDTRRTQCVGGAEGSALSTDFDNVA